MSNISRADSNLHLPASTAKTKGSNEASLQALPVAQTIIGTLAQTQSVKPESTGSPPSKTRSFLELEGPSSSSSSSSSSARRRRKKNNRRKKPKSTATGQLTEPNFSTGSSIATSSAASAALQENRSLFAQGISTGQLPSNVRLLSVSEEALLKEIMNSWQLGGYITIADLLGLDIDSHLKKLFETSQKITGPAAEPIQKRLGELKTEFEANYCLVFISLLFEGTYLREDPQMQSLLDNNFLFTRDAACDKFMSTISQSFKVIEFCISQVKEKIEEQFSKYPKIRDKKLETIKVIEEQLEALQNRFNLCISLLRRSALPLLIDGNILGLCSEDESEISSVEVGFLHLKKLAEFHRDMFRSVRDMGLVGIGFNFFITFVDEMLPQPEKSLPEISRNSLIILRQFLELQRATAQNAFDAQNGELTHLQHCRELGMRPAREKTQEQFTADMYAKYMTTTLACSFVEDLHVIIDRLMQMRSPVYTVKRESYNRIARNFMELQNTSSKKPSEVEEREPSLLNFSLNFDSFFKEVQTDFEAIENESDLSFAPFLDSFYENLEETAKRGFYSPRVWVELFEKMSPVLERIFPIMLSKLRNLKQRYINDLTPIIMSLPFEQRQKALQELKELFLDNSLNVCRRVLFCADLRALMDQYEIDSLKSERFLVPDELCDLVELKGLDEAIEKATQEEQERLGKECQKMQSDSTDESTTSSLNEESIDERPDDSGEKFEEGSRTSLVEEKKSRYLAQSHK